MKTPSADLLSVDSVRQALGPVAFDDSEISDLIQSISKRHRSVLRCRHEVAEAGLPFATKPIQWYGYGRRMMETNDNGGVASEDVVQPSRHLAYACGDYYLQDAGSLLALAALGADRPNTFADGPIVCDLCAAPGGKASAVLEAIGNKGFLLANEPIRSRVAPLAYNLARTGSQRFAISASDPDRLADSLGGQFDIVIVDAPCSGQALLGKGKQSTSALSVKQIQHSAARQTRILAAAIRLLRAGGRLIYSTCTFAHAENEHQVQQLIDGGTAQTDPVDSLANYRTGESTYRLWPHRHQCAGGFAASLRAVADGQGRATKTRKKYVRGHDSRPSIDLCQWYQNADSISRLKSTEAVLYGWPNDVPDWVEQNAVCGPEVAFRTGQTWKPSHAGALRRSCEVLSRQFMDVNDAQAKQYLVGSPIECQQKGWTVVRYEGRPLGWIKASNGVGKNQLPSAARFSCELKS